MKVEPSLVIIARVLEETSYGLVVVGTKMLFFVVPSFVTVTVLLGIEPAEPDKRALDKGEPRFSAETMIAGTDARV